MVELVASYAGQDKGKYVVQVKDMADPKGPGVLQAFDSEKDAQEFIAAVSSKPLAQPSQDGFQKSTAATPPA